MMKLTKINDDWYVDVEQIEFIEIVGSVGPYRKEVVISLKSGKYVRTLVELWRLKSLHGYYDDEPCNKQGGEILTNIIDYMVGEGYPVIYLKAISKIVHAFNWNRYTERAILWFADYVDKLNCLDKLLEDKSESK